MMCCVCIVHADAAVRDSKSINRTNNSSDTETSVIARATTNSRTGTGSVQSGRQSNTVSSRASHQNTISRNSSATSRSASQQTITRSATTPTSRVARSASTTVATQCDNQHRKSRGHHGTQRNIITGARGTYNGTCDNNWFTCDDQYIWYWI